MISVTKLYSFMTTWFIWTMILLGLLSLIQLLFVRIDTDMLLDANQEVHTAIDTARINIREDLQSVNSILNNQDQQLDFIQEQVNWISDNIKSTWSVTNNDMNIQLVHYVAEVDICSIKFPTQKVKVDFYWINPRIESNRLLIIDERYFSNYEAYNVYLPILDKNTDYDADLCSIKILSSSNK